jgi:hypothetical protein
MQTFYGVTMYPLINNYTQLVFYASFLTPLCKSKQLLNLRFHFRFNALCLVYLALFKTFF